MRICRRCLCLSENIWQALSLEAGICRKNSTIDRRSPSNWEIYCCGRICEKWIWQLYSDWLFHGIQKCPWTFEDVSDLNYLFLQLQFQYRTDLIERKSLIIFDEVQLCPLARQAIKSLVKDHRYDYIETGSLISIKKMCKIYLFQAKSEK